MRINDRSKTDFDRAKIKLTGHFDRRPTGRYFEPCYVYQLYGCLDLIVSNFRVYFVKSSQLRFKVVRLEL